MEKMLKGMQGILGMFDYLIGIEKMPIKST